MDIMTLFRLHGVTAQSGGLWEERGEIFGHTFTRSFTPKEGSLAARVLALNDTPSVQRAQNARLSLMADFARDGWHPSVPDDLRNHLSERFLGCRASEVGNLHWAALKQAMQSFADKPADDHTAQARPGAEADWLAPVGAAEREMILRALGPLGNVGELPEEQQLIDGLTGKVSALMLSGLLDSAARLVARAARSDQSEDLNRRSLKAGRALRLLALSSASEHSPQQLARVASLIAEAPGLLWLGSQSWIAALAEGEGQSPAPRQRGQATPAREALLRPEDLQSAHPLQNLSDQGARRPDADLSRQRLSRALTHLGTALDLPGTEHPWSHHVLPSMPVPELSVRRGRKKPRGESAESVSSAHRRGLAERQLRHLTVRNPLEASEAHLQWRGVPEGELRAALSEALRDAGVQGAVSISEIGELLRERAVSEALKKRGVTKLKVEVHPVRPVATDWALGDDLNASQRQHPTPPTKDA